VADGFHVWSCEAEDGWACVPFTTKAKRCDPKDGCEKFIDEWAGDGTCDLTTCGNCHAYWVDGVFDKGDCTESEGEEAVGFSNKGEKSPWWTWFSSAKINKASPPRAAPGSDLDPSGTREIQHIGEGCTVAECVADGFHVWSCEAEDGWACVPFTTKAKRCDPKDGCEKFIDEWAGDGTCDLTTCGNCHAYWVDGVFDKGDCAGSEMEEAVAGYSAYQEAFAAHNAEEGLGVSKAFAVLTYGFAAVGVSVLMFGAFRYYTTKSDYVHLEMA